VTDKTPAILVLADGRTFRGYGFGATGTTLGEAVFTTAMTGYQETMTDPSYHRQIVVSAAPHIGNTGWNDEDNESHGNNIWVAGLVIRDLSRRVSSWRAERSLSEEMQAQGVIGIRGIDTRTLVRHLRNYGSISAGLFSGEAATRPVEELLEEVKSQSSMEGADLAAEVSTDKPYVVEAQGEKKHTIVAFDMGVKSATPRYLSQRGIETIVVPSTTTFAEVQSYNPDGVFVSNGPGDPATADDTVATIKKVLAADIPFFGICFGNQLLGRALGLDTYKMKFGHRGINVPVRNLLTGKIDITSQNHGFALQAPDNYDLADKDAEFASDFGPAHITHICLNDDTVEGVALRNGKAFSVQYHPESAAGPHDANPLFDQFLELMANHTPKK
jgi:carbamoyl-phosphate synthase, small subunit